MSLRHRRNGKTVGLISKVIAKSIECPLPSPRYGYMLPFLKQGREVAWDYLKNYTRVLPNWKPNETSLSITYADDRKISILGADNCEAHRGKYFDGVVVDEFDDMKYSIYSEVLMPALQDRKGWIDFAGTPKGKKNLYLILQMAKANPKKWYHELIKASESGIFTEEELLEMRIEMGSKAYDQEMELSFDSYADGIWELEWYKYYNIKPRNVVFYTWSWDTAIKDEASNDYSVGTYWAMTSDGNHYLLKMVRKKLKYPELKRLVKDLALHYRCNELIIEDKSSGQQLVQEFKRIGAMPPVIGMMPGSKDRKKGMPLKKIERAKYVSPIIESGQVLLPANDPSIAPLLEETTTFPDGLHDDTIDSVTQYLIRRNNAKNMGKPKKLKLGGM